MVKKYIIMCGGKYNKWEKPRHLSVVDGEELVGRTIRLLRKFGIKDISISSDNSIFEKFNITVLKHNNSYLADWNEQDGYKVSGYWCDAFYPTDEPTCYLFGDVYFSERAIKTIVETETDDIEFFASAPPFSDQYIKDHVEPFALKVQDTHHLKKAIEKTKKLEDEGKFWRKPIMWELWTVIKDCPLQKGPDDFIYNYVPINDYTCDIDREKDIQALERKLGGIRMIKCEVIEKFTLNAFSEIENTLVRANVNDNKPGWLYVGDVFECTKDMANYLSGGNAKGKTVVKIIEIVPEITIGYSQVLPTDQTREEETFVDPVETVTAELKVEKKKPTYRKKSKKIK